MKSLTNKPIVVEHTQLLDYETSAIQQLIQERGWRAIQNVSIQIGTIYTFVRDEIKFGHPPHPDQKASEVLALKMGNSITKATLLMALLRAVGIECRIHASSIDRYIYRGLLKGLSYSLCPRTCFHSWVEVNFKGKWISLEGLVIDKPYLSRLQQRFSDYMGSFHGYGIAVLHFRNPPINWEETDTSIRDKAIKKDIGIYANVDALFASHPEILTCSNSFTYKNFVRNRLNKSIQRIRQGR